MTQLEESFELPPEPPVFNVQDESPDSEDVVKDSKANSTQKAEVPKPETTPGPIPVVSKKKKRKTLVAKPAVAPSPAAPVAAGTAPTARVESAGASPGVPPAIESVPTTSNALARIEAAQLSPNEQRQSREATLDNPAFTKFLLEVEKATDKEMQFENEAEMQPLREVFEKRDVVTAGFAGLFAGEAQTFFLPKDLPKKEIVQSIAVHIENLSLTNPEKVLEYHKLFTEAEEVRLQVEQAERQRSPLVSSEEVAEALAGLTEKEKVLSLARESNRFWTGLGGGLGRLTGLAAWVTGSEKLKAQVNARKKVQEMGYGRKLPFGLGSIHYQEIPFAAKGRSLGYGKVQTELLHIKEGIAKLTPETANVQALNEKKKRLVELKRQLLAEGAMRTNVAGITRKSVVSAFQKMIAPASEPVVEELERFETAERLLHDITVAAEGGQDELDAVRGLPSQKQIEQKIFDGVEALAQGIIQRKIGETLQNPHAFGRQSALQRELSVLFSREKVGRHKGERAVRNFIFAELRKYLTEQDALLAKSDLSPDTRTDIRLRKLAVSGLLAAERARVSQTSAVQSGGGTAQTLGERFANIFRDVPSIAHTRRAEQEKTAESIEKESTELTAEQINNLSFDGVLNLKEDDLRKVLSAEKIAADMNVVVIALSDELPDIVEKVRGCLSNDDRARFDRLMGFNSVNSEAAIANAQKEIVEAAKKVLAGKSFL